MISRRRFLQASAIAGGVTALPPGLLIRPAWAQEGEPPPPPFAEDPLPGGSLDPTDIDQYVTPLVIPPVMPRTSTMTIKGGKNLDHYEIAVRQFQQWILPDDGPKTTVWSYGSVNHEWTFNYPAFTIEARWRRPVAVTWRNELVDSRGRYLEHLLPVDPTLHWANPPGGEEGRDSRPMFDDTPFPYTGPVPIVTHLHGSAKVGDESDGYAEMWFLPDADDIPAEYATQGTWYEYFNLKWLDLYGTLANGDAWGPGRATAIYPNDQRAGTLWYHDHTLGMTRLNVYAGPAGFFVIRGGPGDRVFDRRDGTRAKLPGPAPRLGDRANKRYREIPIVIQDRSFDDDGSLFYPDTREFFDGIPGPYIPDSDFSPIWNPEFFGNTMVVNGKTWPKLATERRRYRFRLLNGCDSRFLILRWSDPRVKVWAIGNEGGFLPAPVLLNAFDPEGEDRATLLVGLAERADVIADFSGVPAGTRVILENIGPDEPFRGGVPGVDFAQAHPGTTGQVMAFDVVPARSVDRSTPPEHLVLPSLPGVGPASLTRKVSLLEMMGTVPDEDEPGEDLEGPTAAVLGVVDGQGNLVHKEWSDPITEDPALNAVEVWEIYNATADAHPIHIHETFFQVVNRQEATFVGEPDAPQLDQLGAVFPPEPWEAGYKDTVTAYPGQVTRVKAKFTKEGYYVWHCHIVSHEDNEMMRPYRIGPAGDGAPEGNGGH
jgi:spore coat protein A